MGSVNRGGLLLALGLACTDGAAVLRGGPLFAARPFARPSAARMMGSAFVPGETSTGERLVVVGASGYIGKAVVKEAVRRGYATTAVVRDKGRASSEPKFAGAAIAEANVCDPASLSAPGGPFAKRAVDAVVCCLASRSGTKSDSWAVDYQATLNCVEAALEAGARHFVLLSAYCVRSAELQHPYALQFQYAKKAVEERLVASGLGYSIVRPTAFFKSVSGQLEIVESGAPFVFFDLGEGKSATCNPISEPDLANALIDCIGDPARKDAVWNVGGPDTGLSMVEQGQLIANILGKEEPWLLGVPIGIFDVIVDGLQWAATTFGNGKLEDAAELARIGRYYALEDMLTTNEAERYGTTTLREHYERIAREGQEYAPSGRGPDRHLRRCARARQSWARTRIWRASRSHRARLSAMPPLPVSCRVPRALCRTACCMACLWFYPTIGMTLTPPSSRGARCASRNVKSKKGEQRLIHH
jgi:divinyl chlorophyllide a 8-vinyl-reductase